MVAGAVCDASGVVGSVTRSRDLGKNRVESAADFERARLLKVVTFEVDPLAHQIICGRADVDGRSHQNWIDAVVGLDDPFVRDSVLLVGAHFRF